MFLAFLLACRMGWVRTLEEVLKVKEMIIEADLKEVTASPPVAYRIGKGFTFTSPDGRFQLSLGGRRQIQYQHLDKDDANGPVQDASLFRIRRFKAFMGGHAFTRDLIYRVQVDLAKSGAPQMLEEAWINYRFIEAAQLKAGQYKVPFARQELTSDGALAYDAGFFNGTGQNGTRTNNSMAIAARAVASPFGEMGYDEPDLANTPKPLFSLGANYLANRLKRNGNSNFFDTTTSTPPYAGSKGWLGRNAANTAIFDNTERVDIDMYGIDAAFKWRGFSTQGENFGGTAEGRTHGRTVHARAYYVQAGYFLVPKRLEATARYSCVDPNRDAPPDLQVEATGAVSYYFRGHNLKLQGDYTNIHVQQAAERESTDDKQIRVQAQLAF